MENNCVFCKIASGEIPAKTIYEDEDFRVILDINPASRGHALVLPKIHCANLYELPDELASRIMIVAKKLVTNMTDKLSCDGFNLIQNNGEVAGQTVFHYHLHLIPRYKSDKNDDILTWNCMTYTDEEIEELTQSLKMEAGILH